MTNDKEKKAKRKKTRILIFPISQLYPEVYQTHIKTMNSFQGKLKNGEGRGTRVKVKREEKVRSFLAHI